MGRGQPAEQSRRIVQSFFAQCCLSDHQQATLFSSLCVRDDCACLRDICLRVRPYLLICTFLGLVRAMYAPLLVCDHHIGIASSANCVFKSSTIPWVSLFVHCLCAQVTHARFEPGMCHSRFGVNAMAPMYCTSLQVP